MCCQPSFDKVVPPSFLELGYGNLISIYGELSALGRPPPIIDAAELEENPEVLKLSKCELSILKYFCTQSIKTWHIDDEITYFKDSLSIRYLQISATVLLSDK